MEQTSFASVSPGHTSSAPASLAILANELDCFRRGDPLGRARRPERGPRVGACPGVGSWGTVRREAHCARFELRAIDEGGPTMWVRVATFEGGDTEKLDKLMDERMSSGEMPPPEGMQTVLILDDKDATKRKFLAFGNDPLPSRNGSV
jgi:hypothetical protein